MTVTECKEMAAQVQAELAAESKRDAKGVSWERYQAVCDELEILQSEIEEGCTPADAKVLREANHALADEIEQLKAKVDELPKIKADAIREAANDLTVNYWIDYNDLIEYANKLEAGTL